MIIGTFMQGELFLKFVAVTARKNKSLTETSTSDICKTGSVIFLYKGTDRENQKWIMHDWFELFLFTLNQSLHEYDGDNKR